MEIVTEPDIRTAEQARRYAEELQLLLRSIGASDADMERGQLRVEANVSLRPRGTEPFGTRVEVKNMNSFRAVERAIEFEIERQAAALDAGEPLLQETRGWSEERGETYRMRVKETSDDYRYFPEPDLPPLHLDAAWLAEVRAGLPELPARPPRALSRCPGADRLRRRGARRRPRRDGAVRGDPRGRPRSSSRSRSRTGSPASTCACATRRTDRSSWRPPEFAAIVVAADVRSDLPGPGARGPRGARRDRRERGLDHRRARLPPDLGHAASWPRPWTRRIAANPAAVADYRAGKAQAVGFLVGQVMKATRGQANAALVQATVRARLERTGQGRADGWGW